MEGLIHNWLSDPKIVNYVLASVSIWRYMGFHIVLFMAGLSSVPKDMMEAAVVDGANAWAAPEIHPASGHPYRH